MVTLEKLQARQYVHRGDRFQSVFNIRFKKPKKKTRSVAHVTLNQEKTTN